MFNGETFQLQLEGFQSDAKRWRKIINPFIEILLGLLKITINHINHQPSGPSTAFFIPAEYHPLGDLK